MQFFCNKLITGSANDFPSRSDRNSFVMMALSSLSEAGESYFTGINVFLIFYFLQWLEGQFDTFGPGLFKYLNPLYQTVLNDDKNSFCTFLCAKY
jgi:hypothetical protein